MALFVFPSYSFMRPKRSPYREDNRLARREHAEPDYFWLGTVDDRRICGLVHLLAGSPHPRALLLPPNIRLYLPLFLHRSRSKYSPGTTTNSQGTIYAMAAMACDTPLDKLPMMSRPLERA